MTAPYYVVESPSRGTLVDWWYNEQNKFVPRFSYTILRTDPKNMRFHNLERAQREFDKVKPFVRGDLYLIRMTDADPWAERISR